MVRIFPLCSTYSPMSVSLGFFALMKQNLTNFNVFPTPTARTTHFSSQQLHQAKQFPVPFNEKIS